MQEHWLTFYFVTTVTNQYSVQNIYSMSQIDCYIKMEEMKKKIGQQYNKRKTRPFFLSRTGSVREKLDMVNTINKPNKMGTFPNKVEDYIHVTSYNLQFDTISPTHIMCPPKLKDAKEGI